jgi:hypothetical protein
MGVDRLSFARTSRSVPVDEGRYCPECGQALDLRALGRVGRPDRHPGWSWLLIGLGVYLLTLFGPRAVTHLAADAPTHGQSSDPFPVSLEGASIARVRARAEAAQDPLATFAAGLPREQRDLFGAALGGALVLVGSGSALRRRFRDRAARGLRAEEVWAAPRRSWVDGTALAAWDLGEAASLTIVQLMLVAAAYFAAAAVVEGQPLSGELIDQVTNRTLAFAFEVGDLATSVW